MPSLHRLLALPALQAGSFLFEGWTAVRGESAWAEVPPMRPSPRAIGEAVVDRSFSIAMNLLSGVPNPSELRRGNAEARTARNAIRKKGWLADPRAFHRDPPPVADWEEKTAHSFAGFGPRRIEYRELFYPSEFEPRRELPAGDRWLEQVPNRTAHAMVLEHEGAPRPWVVCVHGFGMGTGVTNLPAFHAERLHGELGLNVLFPTLPLHGPRASGAVSGADLLQPGDFVGIVHAFAQSVWDVRRAIGWVRERAGGRPIALYGLSLGGYTSGLVSAMEEGLACVIAGVPPTDFPTVARDNEFLLQRSADASLQPNWRIVRELTHAVSPLAFEPLVPREQRYLYAGIADRVVRPNQARALWRHWDKCNVHWYSGGHVMGQFHPGVYDFVRDALRRAGLTTARRGRAAAASRSSRKAASRSSRKVRRSATRS